MDCYFDRSIRKVSSFRIPYEEERLTMFPSFPASQRLWIMGRWWTTVFKTIRLFWCSNFSSFLITFFTVERGKSKKGFFFFFFWRVEDCTSCESGLVGGWLLLTGPRRGVKHWPRKEPSPESVVHRRSVYRTPDGGQQSGHGQRRPPRCSSTFSKKKREIYKRLFLSFFSFLLSQYKREKVETAFYPPKKKLFQKNKLYIKGWKTLIKWQVDLHYSEQFGRRVIGNRPLFCFFAIDRIIEVDSLRCVRLVTPMCARLLLTGE